MNSRWAICILVLFLTAVNGNDSIGARELGTSHTNTALTIVAVVMSAVLIFLLIFVVYIHRRRRQAFGQLEEGRIESPASSSRQWFSRFGRYRRDGSSSSSSLNEKDLAWEDEKASPIPRYMRDIPKAPSPTGFIDRPLPASPAIPRSAHVHDSSKSVKMFAPPPSAPLSRTDSLRSQRRMVQVSPRTVTPSPLGEGGRKRELLPNLFKFGAKTRPTPPVGGRKPNFWQNLTPDDLARRMQEKRHAVAVLEAKSRHVDSSVDKKIQSEIADLRHEVNYLNKLLPNGPPPSYNSAF